MESIQFIEMVAVGIFALLLFVSLALLFLILKTQTIMGALDDLKNEVADLKQKAADLQASVDAEQAQIEALLATNAQVVTDLNTQIATLEAQLANGATPEQLQEVIAGIKDAKSTLATTKADLEGTVGESEEEEEENPPT